MNGTIHLLVYADDATLFGWNINTTESKIEIVLDVSEKVGLEMNAEATRYKFMSHGQISWEIL